ncbi:MAG: hypothetical protein KF734_19720 [Saprospiraceae bacterium]|nr:hypothetical protein [Saprospiraceae bacterium]
MKKTIAFSVLLLMFFAGLASFKDTPETEALNTVTRQFHLGMEEISEAIALYLAAAQGLSNNEASVKKLRKAHSEARLAFKKIEFLLEYNDRAGVKRTINGPPLPFVEQGIPDVMPIEPVGLQVLDELVAEENPFAEKDEIVRLTRQLTQDFEVMRQFQSKLKMTHRHIFEAMQQEVVRVFTLGLTGFDTPGTLHALPEAKAAFEGMEAAISAYLPIIESKDRGLAIILDARFDHTIRHLGQSKSFDTFDRLDFLTKHIDPLYELLYQVQRVLGVETSLETSPMPQPVNQAAHSLFDERFLNVGFYAKVDVQHPQFEKRVALGRMLFFDPILSSNHERACASCHQPEKAFTDGLSKSLATEGQGHIKRNAPTLLNCVFSESFFYDLRERQLSRQILHVVVDSLEFSTTYPIIIEKLNQSGLYKKMFRDAYSDNPQYSLSAYSISDALASYVASLNAFNSPFDRFVRGDTAYLDPAAYRGFNLFMGKANCGICHFAPVFNGTVPPLYTESESEVLGVPLRPDTLNAPLDPDLGRFDSGKPRDKAPFFKHSFKTPTVRNVALTAPYMHNGVYQTLEEVIDFYNRGGGAGIGIQLSHQTLPDAPLQLSPQEQRDLIAFLHSLTDNPSHLQIRPDSLPLFEGKPEWNRRKVGGDY